MYTEKANKAFRQAGDCSNTGLYFKHFYKLQFKHVQATDLYIRG